MSNGSANGVRNDSPHELDALQERLLHIAGHEPQGTPFGIDDHVDDEVAAGAAGDPGVFFVDRIAVQDAAIRPRILQQLRPVPDLDRLQGGNAGADQLPPAREPGHQVRLDQANRDLEICLNVARIQPDRNASG